MTLADLAWTDLLLLILGATGIGFSKSGFAGVGMIHVVIFASVFGARLSTGILLPLLIVGDVLAIKLFGAEVQWPVVRRLLVPTMVGVVLGWLMLARLHENSLKPIVGAIILLLVAMQVVRIWRPKLFERVPHALWFTWMLGMLAGVTTMLANAAGPVIALYLVSVALPKFQLIGTSAWFFFIVNVAKVPFSASLNLITWDSLAMNGLLAPSVVLGMIAGRWLVHRIPQKSFDTLVLVLTAIAAARLIFSVFY